MARARSATRRFWSFDAPLANVMERLRRGGIDPNSAQAQSLITNVESQRARAMDDAIASRSNAYFDRVANIGMAEQDAREPAQA